MTVNFNAGRRSFVSGLAAAFGALGLRRAAAAPTDPRVEIKTKADVFGRLSAEGRLAMKPYRPPTLLPVADLAEKLMEAYDFWWAQAPAFRKPQDLAILASGRLATQWRLLHADRRCVDDAGLFELRGTKTIEAVYARGFASALYQFAGWEDDTVAGRLAQVRERLAGGRFSYAWNAGSPRERFGYGVACQLHILAEQVAARDGAGVVGDLQLQFLTSDVIVEALVLRMWTHTLPALPEPELV